MIVKQPDIAFYLTAYQGFRLPEEHTEFFLGKAQAVVSGYTRNCECTPVLEAHPAITEECTALEVALMLAVCAVADELYRFDAVQSGEYGTASVSVGSVSTTRVQPVPDVSRRAINSALLAAARQYLRFESWCAPC